MKALRNFWNDDQGQDLIEYTLLMAFVALASAALFLGAGGSIQGIWSTTNSQLVAANSSASSTQPGLPGPARLPRRTPRPGSCSTWPAARASRHIGRMAASGR